MTLTNTNPCVCVSGQGKNCLPEPRGKEKTARRQGVCNYTHDYTDLTTATTPHHTTTVCIQFNYIQADSGENNYVLYTSPSEVSCLAC